MGVGTRESPRTTGNWVDPRAPSWKSTFSHGTPSAKYAQSAKLNFEGTRLYFECWSTVIPSNLSPPSSYHVLISVLPDQVSVMVHKLAICEGGKKIVQETTDLGRDADARRHDGCTDLCPVATGGPG